MTARKRRTPGWLFTGYHRQNTCSKRYLGASCRASAVYVTDNADEDAPRGTPPYSYYCPECAPEGAWRIPGLDNEGNDLPDDDPRWDVAVQRGEEIEAAARPPTREDIRYDQGLDDWAEEHAPYDTEES